MFENTSPLTRRVTLRILAQLASAIQFILEEIFLKRRKAPPLQIVGSEGDNFALVSSSSLSSTSHFDPLTN